MKRGILQIGILMLVAILITACAPQVQEQAVDEEETTIAVGEPTPGEAVEEPILAAENTIEITAEGFSPSTITVTKGTTVTWINMDTERHWVASASHPTHTVYPTTGGCIGSTFDACAAMEEGDAFSFTFDEIGEWKYHDHLNPSNFGSVVVQ